MTMPLLPIFEIKNALLDAVVSSKVVVTAPTGSGKSTELPRWMTVFGKVLVIEPRRVACVGLASRVSFLEQTSLGAKVGYSVRQDSKSSNDTQILFVTPGVALKFVASKKIREFAVVILDEFHERSIETDLLLALLKKNFQGKLLVTSATIDAHPLTKYLRARHLQATGSLFPVEVHHVAAKDALPSAEQLPEQVAAVVARAHSYPGDILVFLPGKAQIHQVAQRLAQNEDINVFLMHGDLSLVEQQSVFTQASKRKVVLTTNVCETSITVPGIGVVIDSGLVKRTRFVDDRGFLTMMPIAHDSAEQRKGRAGRMAEGVCFRLWSRRAVLEKYTPAEIFRGSLTQMVLAVASCGETMDALDFYQAPKAYAIDAAVKELTALGAIDSQQCITARGKALFGLPLSAQMAALLVDAEKEGLLPEAIALVSVADASKELFQAMYRPEHPEDDFRRFGCDVRATLLALSAHGTQANKAGVNWLALQDVKKRQRELSVAFGVKKDAPLNIVNVPRLVALFVRTHPRSGYIARRKKGKLFFSNGDGKEIMLSSSSSVDEKTVEAIVVFASMATGLGYREKDARIIATLASPVKRSTFVNAGLGTLQVTKSRVVKGKVVANVERVYAGCILASREEVPQGSVAQDAIIELFLKGVIFKPQLLETGRRLAQARLLKQILIHSVCDEPLDIGVWQGDIPTVEQWIAAHIAELGIESGSDFELLGESDFLATPLPKWTQDWLEANYSQNLNLGDVQYEVLYDFSKRVVTLNKIGGTRKSAPSINIVPNFRGFKIKVKHHSQTWVLRH